MLRCAITVSTWLLVMSCGDDDATPSNARDAAPANDAIVSAKEIGVVVTDAIGVYDQLLTDNCPCYVEMGAYDTVEECLMWQGSREAWIPCLRKALAMHQTPEALEMFRCMTDVAKVTMECLATKGCDPVERGECGPSPIQCVAGHTELALDLGTQCPDISLLPRLN
jgi:hypothetical protein